MVFWFFDDKLVVSGGALVDCDHCPCTVTPIEDCGDCLPGTTPASFICEFSGVAYDGHCADYNTWNTTSLVVTLSNDVPCQYEGDINVCGSTFRVYIQQAFLGNVMYVIIQQTSFPFEYANAFENYDGDTSQCDDFEWQIPNLEEPLTGPYGDWSGATCTLRSLP